MRSKTRGVGLILLAGVTLAANGCAKKWQTGAVVGAGGGAVAGAAVGQVAGSTTKGAIIGAVVGGVAGGLIGNEMDKRAAELRQNIKGAKVERVGEGIQVTFDSGLLFDIDSDDLRAEARTNLGELANSFDKYEDSDILIAGHTDNTGTEAHNQKLSIDRADAAAGYLVDHGVSGKRIRTVGLGEMEPIETNETAAGRQANRRIEVAIYASKDMQEAAKKKAAGS